MDGVHRPLSHLMNPISRDELFRAREERRRRLAELPFEEKVRLMEKLQAAGRTLRAARSQLIPRVNATPSSIGADQDRGD